MSIGAQNPHHPTWGARIEFDGQHDHIDAQCHAENEQDARDTFKRMFYTGRIARIWKCAPDWVKQKRREGKLK